MVPKTDERMIFYMDLYEQATVYNALPVAGGLLDQPTRTMSILGAIHDAVAERADARAKKAHAKAKSDRMKPGTIRTGF